MTAEGTSVGESVLSKLTIATMGCDPKSVNSTKPEDQGRLVNGEMPLARLYGKLNSVKYKEDKEKSGEVHTAFIGTFEGINQETGEVFRSGVLYLPRGLQEIVEDAINKAHAADKNASVAFAFEIRSVRSNNRVGYTYKALMLKSPEAHDELSEIRALVQKAGAIDTKRLANSQTGAGPKTLDGGSAASQEKPVKKSA